jgi:hypothetical protein
LRAIWAQAATLLVIEIIEKRFGNRSCAVIASGRSSG